MLENLNIERELTEERIPGQIIMIKKYDGIMIMTNDYPILIKYAQLEGKKSTDSYTLSIQTHLIVKNIFGS